MGAELIPYCSRWKTGCSLKSLHRNTHSAALGQEVAGPRLVNRLCSQVSLADHLFGF